MTPGQGLWIAIDLTILAALMGIMMVVITIAALKIADKVSHATDQLQAQVREVSDKAHRVLDQAQQTVGVVASRVGQVEKVVSGVSGAIVGAKIARSARSVARNSADMANSVLLGIKTGMERLLHPPTNGRGNDDG